MSKEDAAYLAGLIDGEGCIGTYWRKDGNAGKGCQLLTVAFCMTDREVLDWVADVTRLGKVHPVKAQRKKNHSQAYNWRCCSEGAATLLEQTEPYLRIKEKIAKAKHLMALQARVRNGDFIGPRDVEFK
jgi:hypothetical protein